jgi:hypothetical protein
MKKLRFESLELLSLKEQRARQILFHPKMTVIIGENDVGKSSVIKSIYWTLGAEAGKIHPSWVEANIKSLLTFTIDGVRFRALRDRDNFAFFSDGGELLIRTNRLVKELAPFMARLLDFRLVLSNRAGDPEIPPPAYAFLPFYIDQDDGWAKPLESFARLDQFSAYKKPVIEFHTGILPNEFYVLDADKRQIQVKQREFLADRNVVQKAIEKAQLNASFDGLELSADGHEVSIERLLVRLKHLREARRLRAAKLAEILDQRVITENQTATVRAALLEIEKDINFTKDLPERILCPTCGTSHQNDFANRYSIIEDREACLEFIFEAVAKVQQLAASAASITASVGEADTAMAEIKVALDSKKDDISLEDVIESKGRRIAADLFRQQFDGLTDEISKLVLDIKEIEDKLKVLKDKKRREKIVGVYAQLMLSYLDRLDVSNYSVQEFTRLPAKISETGSDLPRSILAYFLAVLNTMHEFSTSFFGPIVIDSPNQQDQDAKNVGSMIDLIVNAAPDDAQVILGTVSLHDQKFEDAAIIEFTDKLKVLRPDEFESVKAKLQPFVDEAADFS